MLRDGETFTRGLTIGEARYEDAEGATQTVGRIGVVRAPPPRRRYGPLEAGVEGVAEVGRTLEMTVTYLGRLVTGREDVREIGGPLKIGQYAGQAARSGFQEAAVDVTIWQRLATSGANFALLAAVISVSIGFLNLLPVPVLDGGHLVFYAYEAVAGQPLPDRVQGASFTIGLALVGTLMVFVVVNDVIGML